MNWLDLVIILFIAWGALKGFSLGLIRTFFGTVGLVAGLAGAYWYAPQLGEFLDRQYQLVDWATTFFQDRVSPSSFPDGNLAASYHEAFARYLTKMGYVRVSADFGAIVYEGLGNLVVEALSFLLIFVVIRVVLGLAASVLHRTVAWGPVAGLNRLTGLIFGAAQNAVILALGLGLVTPFLSVGLLQPLAAGIEGSRYAQGLLNVFPLISPWL